MFLGKFQLLHGFVLSLQLGIVFFRYFLHIFFVIFKRTHAIGINKNCFKVMHAGILVYAVEGSEIQKKEKKRKRKNGLEIYMRQYKIYLYFLITYEVWEDRKYCDHQKEMLSF